MFLQHSNGPNDPLHPRSPLTPSASPATGDSPPPPAVVHQPLPPRGSAASYAAHLALIRDCLWAAGASRRPGNGV